MASISGVELVKRSLTMLGAFGEGETLDAYRGEQARITLNYLFERWNLDGITVYCHETKSFTLVIGQANYTIGTGGSPNISTVRPTFIDSMYIRDGGTDVPITQITLDQYIKLPSKSDSASYPSFFCYDSQFPLGVIRFSQVPSAVYTCYYTVPRAFTELTSLATAISYPDGYARAIETNLAMDLAVFYPGKVSAELAQAARDSKDEISRLNYAQRAGQMQTEHSGIGNGGTAYSIYTMDVLP